MTVSLGNGVDIGNIVTAETSITGGIELTAGDRSVLTVSADASAEVINAPSYPTIAVIGDSIIAASFFGTGGNVYYATRGVLTWALQRLGFPWDFQIGDMFAISGAQTGYTPANLGVLSHQLPLLKARHATRRYQRCFIEVGVNDCIAGTSLSEIIANSVKIFDELRALGIIPVHLGILPHAPGGQNSINDAKRKALAYNNWLSRYANETGRIEFIPGCHEAVANNTNGDGNYLSTHTTDWVHQNTLGAYMISDSIYKYYSKKYIPSALNFAQSQADIYDATHNRRGVLGDAANPMMLGGTTAPTGMTFFAGGTPYVTSEKGSRTLENGQARPTVVFTVTNSSGSTLSDAYLEDKVTAIAGWDETEKIQSGDVVYGQAIVEIVSGSPGLNPHLHLEESNGSTTITSGVNVNEGTGEIGKYGNGDIVTLRTPNITIRNYGGSGNASLTLKFKIRCKTGTSAVVALRAFEMRKAIFD